MLVWLALHLNKREKILILIYRPSIEVEELVILSFKMSLPQFERHEKSVRAVYGNVTDASFFNDRVLKEALGVKSSLIVDQHDVLTTKPSSCLLLCKAVITILAEIELYRNLLSFVRIIIAPNFEVLSPHASELLLPSIDHIVGSLKDREREGRACTVLVGTS